MVGDLERTAIAIDDAKQAALYFDFVIPMNLACDLIIGSLRSLEGKKWHDRQSCYAVMQRAAPSDLLKSLLPPQLWKASFTKRLAQVNCAMVDYFFERLKGNLGVAEEALPELHEYASGVVSLLDDFKLWALPADVPFGLVTEGTINEAEVAITLASLQIADVKHASWEQILEFRRDGDAHNKLRRLRLFACENYAGKSKSFVEDDISVKLYDYEVAVKKWGFGTKYAAFTTLLSSKTLAGALTGSLISTLFGAPLPALVSAAVGVALEVGHVSLEVGKQRFALRELMAENPVCYISEARSKLQAQA